jgi:hypothetical protein
MREFLAFVLAVLVLVMGTIVVAPSVLKTLGNIKGNRDEIQNVSGVGETQHYFVEPQLG